MGASSSSLFYALCHWLQQNSYAIGIDLLLSSLIAYPLFDYLFYGWVRKEYEISKSLTNGAKQAYLNTFHKIEVSANDAATVFDQLYLEWYGRQRFLFPIVFILLVTLIENFALGGAFAQLASKWELGASDAAIAGAYTFVTWDFFARMQRRNLSPADTCRGALRLAIAIPVGYVFSVLLQPSLGPFIAFAVGVFPIGALGLILRQLANKKLGLEIGAAEASDQVVKLSGVDLSTAARIEDADITTIAQLAWCDPIQLSMRSNLSFAYVVDIVSQALAWVYLGDRINDLRTIGLRGAYEISVFLDDLDSDDADEKKLAQNTLPVASEIAHCPIAGLMYAFEQIAQDPNTNFLCEAA